MLNCCCPDLGTMCLYQTDGEPQEVPGPGETPIQYDPNTGSLWFFDCDQELWIEWPDENFSLCALPELTQQEVDDAGSVMLAACVDTQDVLIPVPVQEPFAACDLDLTSDQIAYVDYANGEAEVYLVACVITQDDGPITTRINPYSICRHPEMTPQEVQDYLDSLGDPPLLAAACVGGEERLAPINQYFPQTGTWPVVIFGSTTAGDFSFTKQDATYTRIGDDVFFNIHIEGTWVLAPAGDIQVTLPFTVKDGLTAIISEIKHSDIAAESDILAMADGLTTEMVLHKYGVNGATIAITDADQISVNNTLIVQGRFVREVI